MSTYAGTGQLYRRRRFKLTSETFVVSGTSCSNGGSFHDA